MWQAIRPRTLKQLSFVRGFHQQSIIRAHELSKRAIVKVWGTDASPFLQGLMTNDIKHLDEDGNLSMYCMFLNTQGRVLYDAIIYSQRENGSYLLECDATYAQQLAKHLTMYKVRRKVNVAVDDTFKPWVFFDQPPDDLTREALVSRDPRVKELGWRVLINSEKTHTQLANCVVDKVDHYTELRYKLGVGEGADDMPIGACFPLECNCDYLHGVSFHKGCYLGQELTARTYHTGVIRKRVMPIVLQHPCELLEKDATITDETGHKVGKLRSYLSGTTYGLGLLRIQQVLAAKELKVDSNLITTHRPSWWPIEAPKERSQLDASSH